MYRLTDLTDLGSDASFPNGFPKEATSPTSNDGTKYDRAFMNDWFNFFWKCVTDAGITPNGNPDNGDDVNQLFDAIKRVLNKKEAVFLNQTAGDDTSYTVTINDDILFIGTFVSGSPTITLPISSEFTGKTIKCIHNIGNGGSLDINDFNNITIDGGSYFADNDFAY